MKDSSAEPKSASGSYMRKFQEVVLGGLERGFYNYGKFVSR